MVAASSRRLYWLSWWYRLMRMDYHWVYCKNSSGLVLTWEIYRDMLQVLCELHMLQMVSNVKEDKT